MEQYRTLLISCVIIMCAIAGYAASLAMPGVIAAPIGTVIGIFWGRMNDEVTDKFQTEADRILQPTDAMKSVMAGGVLLALAASSVAALFVPAIYASPLGFMILMIAVKYLMGL